MTKKKTTKKTTKASSKAKQAGTVRFGVIGTGGMGTGHSNSLQKVRYARLTAVSDIDMEAAERVGRQFTVPFFNDHKKLIKAGLCDAVIIATPHPQHAEVAIACMNAGLHVLSEKPLSERVSAAEKMVKAARKNKVVFAVMFQRRFEPAIAKAMQMIKSGKVGQIYRTVMISPEYRSQSYYDSGTWRATWGGEGGGVMMNQSPHILDVFVQLCGMPSEVLGRIETRMHHIEVEDQAEAMLKYPGGGTGYLYCSTNEAGPGQMIEIFGDKGKLVLRDGQLSFYRFEPGIRKHIKTFKQMWGAPQVIQEPVKIADRRTGHADVIRNMVRHILFGEELVACGESGVASLELANAIMLSSSEGKWVKIPISRRKYDEHLAKLRRTSTFVKKGRKTLRITDPGHKQK